jgi:hypothetical protein
MKGKLLDTFTHVQASERFALVSDCDLYQPALDTFEFLWDKIVLGGVWLILTTKTNMVVIKGWRRRQRNVSLEGLRKSWFSIKTLWP